MSLPRDRCARSTRPDRRRVGGGWLSLFAMWMIFIGPLVSQSMPMNHHAGMNMDMDMAMPMAAGHDHAAMGHGDHGGDGHAHALWEKCGYCTLLFNCPALPQTLSPLSASSAPPPTLAAITPRQGHARQAVFPGARSRAPPRSISV
ncbi:DUF2946 domain-containing protein [Pseudomonas entomophila]|uniref:DUF2946 domain-containing protein n=1 Tax=Pseudomonas entomophila TaxID=312306 RepID=UPI0023D85BFD|nr:DUF2946 domain-containing protein [Pseudomonas entomophila]MDF0733783.1 DUF2946 domain-containing protein [Pseudomonas entomophila]